MPAVGLDPTIPVLDRYARGWPAHESGEPATYGPFSEACSTRFYFDAHFCAASAPAMPRRLSGDAALSAEPAMVMFVVDVDGPDHRWTPEWWAGERKKVLALFDARGDGYAYCTRGGYRICYSLGRRDDLVLRRPEDKRRWSRSYLDWLAILAEYGIAGDEACKDAFRIFRLPRVRRDDRDEQPAEELGSSAKLGVWREPLCAADDPRLARAPAESTAAAAPVPPDQLAAAKLALAEAWPLRGRHAASLALCGALARMGWDDEAVAGFVDDVCQAAAEMPGRPALGPEASYEKRLSQARSSAEKVARGEEVAGWGSLELAIGDSPGAPDLLLEARRQLGCGPAVELFAKARAALAPSAEQKMGEAIVKAGAVEMQHEPRFLELCQEASDRMSPALAGAAERAKNPTLRRRGMSAREIRARRMPAPRYLVEYLMVAGGVFSIAGEPKSGKSWDLIHLTIAIAAQRPAYGLFATPHPAATYCRFLEDPEGSLNNRIFAIAAGMGLDPDGPWTDRWHCEPRGEPLDVLSDFELFVEAASMWFLEERCGHKIQFFGIDPLSDAHSGEEDSRDSMSVVMNRLRAFAVAMGLRAGVEFTVGFVHHSAKSTADGKGRRGGQKMRGSSAIHAALDGGMYLSSLRGEEGKVFLCRIESELKSARSAGFFDRKIEVEDDEHGNARVARFSADEADDADAEPQDLVEERAVTVVHRLFDHGDGHMTVDQLRDKIRGSKGDMVKSVDIAIEAGWIAPVHHGQKRVGVRITEAGRELVREGGKRGGGEGGTDDAPAGGSQAGPPVPGALATWMPRA